MISAYKFKINYDLRLETLPYAKFTQIIVLILYNQQSEIKNYAKFLASNQTM